MKRTAFLISFLLILLSSAIDSMATVSLSHPMQLKKGEVYDFGIVDGNAVEIEVTGAMASNRDKSGIGKNSWGIGWNSENGERYEIRLSWGNTDFSSLTDTRFLRLTLSRGEEILTSEDMTRGVDLHKGSNSLKIKLFGDGEIKWTIGSDGLAAAGSMELPGSPDLNSLFLFCEGTSLEITRLIFRGIKDENLGIMTIYDSPEKFPVPDDISTSPEGIWVFLDRETDPKWARLGGQYKLGILADPLTGNYDIIYLEGAVSNSGKWKTGMKKGSLTSTPFIQHYDLEWHDAMHEKIGKDEECWASLNDDGSILTLNFPLDHSVLRFYRPTKE